MCVCVCKIRTKFATMELGVFVVKNDALKFNYSWSRSCYLRYLFACLIFKWHFSNRFDEVVTSIL